MKLIVTTCYTHILWIMCAGPLFKEAVHQMHITASPDFASEGVAGYIETTVEFEIASLEKFTNLWNSYYSLSESRRLDLYGLAKGLGSCR